MTEVSIWTDGACRGNPGPGGWGAILRFGDAEKEIYGSEARTTNNRMELLAAISALEALNRRCHVVLTSDSEYLRRGITEWIVNWKRRGWMTANRTPVLNRDLWERLDTAAGRHDVDWRWIRGHSGHPENERADALANRAIDEMQA